LKGIRMSWGIMPEARRRSLRPPGGTVSVIIACGGWNRAGSSANFGPADAESSGIRGEGRIMMRPGETTRITRRDVLAGGLASAGALLLHERWAPAAPSEDRPYGPFQMGLQSYSLRGIRRDGKPDLAKALAITRELGLSYWESAFTHLSPS